MNINQTQEYINSLLNKSDKKREMRLYKRFLGILMSIEKKDLTEVQFQLIDKELGELKLDAEVENQRKYLAKQLAKFEKFLTEEFSFRAEGFYVAMGMVFGMSIGVALGTSLLGDNGTSYGISLGMILGLAVGAGLDERAKKQGKTYETKIK